MKRILFVALIGLGILNINLMYGVRGQLHTGMSHRCCRPVVWDSFEQDIREQHLLNTILVTCRRDCLFR